MVDVAEVIQQCWLEESEQWLENVDRTHLVLASRQPVLQKTSDELCFQTNVTPMPKQVRD